ncbi:hypothetical protein A3E89_00920 [Candidatus Campbellbacteria bacterium RIFCSPHIGHO2_12_FULL_35_10]|uniref:Uncharacterized protein n=1 Tax=Candidatus Campbellbacteria bacterium RIFCSPHIGHO2_12_FULL_35_10 TaxID=1797578 RepID=A0A1F5EP33_9BACT|nr:MAG: hypothetical protein A3E89_00920 [Candidatus Campbellbacteria bacterium RIFCSPHIGHO2_12_FULL_35_10]
MKKVFFSILCWSFVFSLFIIVCIGFAFDIVQESFSVSNEPAPFFLGFSTVSAILFSMFFYLLKEKRAYENYIMSEIKRINELYRLNILNSSKIVFGFLSRSKGILQNPESVLRVGSANEQIASFLLREDCTREFISSSILGLRSALRPSKYDDLLKIFSGVADSLNYPIKCKYFPTFELVGGKMSDTYWGEKSLVTFKVDFFFGQLREIEQGIRLYEGQLKKEIERLEKLELEDQE